MAKAYTECGAPENFRYDYYREYQDPANRKHEYEPLPRDCTVAEMMDRYGLYGIELDFQREFNCFPHGLEEEGRKCILSYADTCAIGDVVKAVLPVTLTKEDSLPTYLKINTGSLLPSEKVYLRAGCRADLSGG